MAKQRFGPGTLVATGILGWVLLSMVISSTSFAGAAQRSSSLGEANEGSAPGSCPSGMVQIPAGTYWMGSDNGDADEKPVHQVTLAGFCLDRTEVTVAAYAECTRRGECSPAPTTADWPGINEQEKALDSQFCNGTRADRQQHPINCVDWTQAETYCRAVGKRLPTEEEWEYAARGDDGRMYPWGSAAPDANLLNSLGAETVAMGERLGHPGWVSMFSGNDGWETTAPVGSYPEGASPFGALDMAGNVWEFTSSGYSPDYRSQRSNDVHVYRGGGWGFGDPSFVRTTNRGKGVLAYRGADLGFRCAKAQ
jgi:formylglycine-generating enzyme required for sulfatase activity